MNEAKKQWIERTLFYVASFFMPCIFLFNLYNRNYAQNHISFESVLLVAGVLAIAGILLFLIFKFAFKNAENALVLSVLIWVYFWIWGALFRLTTSIADFLVSRGLQFMTLLGWRSFTVFYVFCGVALLIGCIFLLRRYKPPFEKFRSVFNTLSISIIVLFVFNLTPAINNEIIISRARTEGAEFYIKRTFHVDPSLPAPDIYWLHLDGMMSIETFERFFEEPQDNLREELAHRGFIVYEDALLEIGHTRGAIPALLSPAFYDSFLGECLAKAKTELSWDSIDMLNVDLGRAGLTVIENISPYYELFNALITRGYDIDNYDRHESGLVPLSFEYLKGDYTISRWHRFFSMDLAKLLTQTTPLNINIPLNLVHPAHASVDVREHRPEPLASFIWRYFNCTHGNNWWKQDPSLTSRDKDHAPPYLYPLAYEEIVRKMFDIIDAIIEKNPGAVIVLQSDHGLHLQTTQEYLLEQDYPLELVFELIYSVFSAVRIPPQYGGLDEPIAPLNISRELVNRFVGENYELLP